MRIIIKTHVEQDFKKVFQAFDINLFMKLKPPLVGLNVIRFDGCKKGDKVQIEIRFLWFKQRWHSDITENHENEKSSYFIDKGRLLPWPLKKWKHVHKIEKSVENSIIIDDICYNTGNKLLDILIFPALFLQFYYRKPVYKFYFRN
jgi:ligand-binding SRPBCC domain-containing protein